MIKTDIAQALSTSSLTLKSTEQVNELTPFFNSDGNYADCVGPILSVQLVVRY